MWAIKERNPSLLALFRRIASSVLVQGILLRDILVVGFFHSVPDVAVILIFITALDPLFNGFPSRAICSDSRYIK